MSAPTPPSVARGAAGAGITVAIVDSGVNFDHPHLGVAGEGFAVEWDEDALVVHPSAHRDLYGHGTCCAALVHLLAPAASILAVRVTAERPTTDAERLARGIALAAERGAQVVCVPSATETARKKLLLDAVHDARARQVVVVAADPGSETALPARAEGVVGVSLEDGVDVALRGERVVAEGRARPAPGHPRNFHGPSLSAARAAAAIARFAEESGLRGDDLARGFKRTLVVL